VQACSGMSGIATYHRLFQLATNSTIFQPSLYHMVSYKHDRDTEKSNRNRAALPDFHPSSGDHTTCTFPGVKRPERIADHKLDTQLS
jgi:hypothetical protein